MGRQKRPKDADSGGEKDRSAIDAPFSSVF